MKGGVCGAWGGGDRVFRTRRSLKLVIRMESVTLFEKLSHEISNLTIKLNQTHPESSHEVYACLRTLWDGSWSFLCPNHKFENFDLWDPGAPVLVGWTGVA